MRRSMLVLLALAVLAATAAASGGRGVLGPSGGVRYVAVAGGDSTTVRAVRVRDGHVLRTATLAGAYAVPVVAADGSTGGVSADGKTLVLASTAGSRFAVLATATLRARTTIELPGDFAYDAISPNGRIVYLIETLSPTNYRVRAYDVPGRRLFSAVVVDKREANEPMQGYAVTRATARDGTWAYTLYGREEGVAFIHALGTPYRTAVCIDLPWGASRAVLMKVKLAVSADGTQLVLRDRRGRLATVQFGNPSPYTYKVKAVRRPG